MKCYSLGGLLTWYLSMQSQAQDSKGRPTILASLGWAVDCVDWGYPAPQEKVGAQKRLRNVISCPALAAVESPGLEASGGGLSVVPLSPPFSSANVPFPAAGTEEGSAGRGVYFNFIPFKRKAMRGIREVASEA